MCKQTERVFNIIKFEVTERAKRVFKGTSKEQLILDSLAKVVLEYDKMRSRIIATANHEKLNVRYGELLITYDDNTQAEVFRHEFMHIVANLWHGKQCGHSADFKNMCLTMGYDRKIGMAVLSNEDTVYKPGKEPKKEIKVDNNYKIVVECSCCGKMVARYKRKGKVVDNITRYRSTCCKADLVVKGA